MNALKRLWTFGAHDADRRVAAFLQRRDHDGVNSYLLSSVSLSAIDHMTRRLEAWWLESRSGRAAIAAAHDWSRARRSSRHQILGVVVLAAVATHLALMLWQGPPPQWYWLLLPALAAAVGVLLLVSARATDSPRDE